MCLALGIGSTALGQDLTVSGTTVVISLPGASLATLNVIGPEGFHMEGASKTGSVSLKLDALGRLPDGTYNYDAAGATGEKASNRYALNNGRDNEPSTISAGVTASGAFIVKNGAIQVPEKASDKDRDG
jgi:hypothetical protein